jgi:hypothetical protein
MATTGIDHELIAPEDPATGPIGEAAAAGDYPAFRKHLSGYEQWLRLRVGRRIELHPDAQARLGGDLRIGDAVELVYLTAFEGFNRRPTAVPLGEWLEGLIDPAVRALLNDPDEERAAVSFARTTREMPED